MYRDWHDGSGGGGGHWLALAVMLLVFGGLLAAFVVYLVRSSGQHHEPPKAVAPAEDSALRILNERFARGEVDAEEYVRRRDLLRGS